MKNILSTLLTISITVFSSMVYAADESPKTKQICTDVKDKAGNVVLNKDGTARQTCRTIKIHEKYEGTVVPTKPVAKSSGFDSEVQKRQRELIAVGAKITADGITGPGTRRAETEFGHLVPKK
jgi:hypothetical protein